MKKLVISVLCFITSGVAFALPLDNPAQPALLCNGLFWEGDDCCLDICAPGASWCESFAFRVGYYGDFVFDRHLEIDRCESDDSIEKTRLFTNAGLIILNFKKRADLFFTVGATNMHLRSNAFTFGGGNGRCLDLETETDFSWSIGGRLIAWECGCTTLGVEAQYFATKLNINRISVGCDNSEYPDSCIDFKYKEWQFGVALAHRICCLVPYIGVKWSKAKANFGDALIPFTEGTVTLFTLTLHDLENSRDWGWALGVTLVDCFQGTVTVEARFADEKAVFVNGQIRL